MKIYIAGKINGDENYLEKFKNSENHCIVNGWETINPASFPRLGWKESMRRDLKLLNDCQAIYMINDWKDSKGATLEHWYAKRYELIIIYEN